MRTTSFPSTPLSHAIHHSTVLRPECRSRTMKADKFFFFFSDAIHKLKCSHRRKQLFGPSCVRRQGGFRDGLLARGRKRTNKIEFRRRGRNNASGTHSKFFLTPYHSERRDNATDYASLLFEIDNGVVGRDVIHIFTLRSRLGTIECAFLRPWLNRLTSLCRIPCRRPRTGRSGITIHAHSALFSALHQRKDHRELSICGPLTPPSNFPRWRASRS